MKISRRTLLQYGMVGATSLLLPPPLFAANSHECPKSTRINPKRKRFSASELARLNISLHPKKYKHHQFFLGLMEEGLKKHGLSPFYDSPNTTSDSDVAICWSIKHNDLLNHRKQHGLNTLIMERGFIQPRKEWTSISWEGIGNCGHYITDGDGKTRWEQNFAHHLKPWKEGNDGYILLMGQVPNDRALYGLRMNDWLSEIAKALLIHEKEILFRPHPKKRASYLRDKNPLPLPAHTKLSPHKDLQKDLAGAAFSVTYSSTAAVESVLAGIPCVTFHEGSIARPVTSQDIMTPYFRPDRTKWCHETALKQWSHEEIRNGDAWDALKQYLLV